MQSLPVTADLSLMRELNQALILSLVRQEGQISRAEIAKRTNLSRSTVSNIINELIESGRIFEVHKGESRGGRRPILLELNYRSRCVAGVELATTTIRIVIADLQAVVLHQQAEPFDIACGPDQALAHVQALLKQALQRADVRMDQIAGVGISVPGPLSVATGRTIAPPIMPGWDGFELRDRFQAVFPFPVVIDNDANMGALAEYQWGAAQGIRNVAYVYLGSTGVGAGLVLNGAIYRGEIGSAGEIGHVMVDEHGPLCSCGSHGCLEAMVGLPHMLERAAQRSDGRIHTLEQMIDAARSDPSIAAIFTEAGCYLGVAIASVLNVYNPGMVVIGGPLAEADDLLLDPLRRTVEQRTLPIALEHCPIVVGALGMNAVAIGAAGQIIQGVFSPSSLGTLVQQL